jgi:hypothetical protein
MGELVTMRSFPQGCADWFCFVDAIRRSFETDTIVVGEHSGSLNILENTPTWDIDGGAQRWEHNAVEWHRVCQRGVLEGLQSG